MAARAYEVLARTELSLCIGLAIRMMQGNPRERWPWR